MRLEAGGRERVSLVFDLVASKHLLLRKFLLVRWNEREVSICGGGKRRRRMRFATRPVGSTPPPYGLTGFAPSLREPCRRLSCRGCGFCSNTHPFSLICTYTLVVDSSRRGNSTRVDGRNIGMFSETCNGFDSSHQRPEFDTRPRFVRFEDRARSNETSFWTKLARSLPSTLRRARNEGRCLRSGLRCSRKMVRERERDAGSVLIYARHNRGRY